MRQHEFTEAKQALVKSSEAIEEGSDDPVLLAEVNKEITAVSENLANIISKLSEDLVPLTHSEIEITDINSVKEAFEKHQPDVVINTAAFHRVDDCEDDPDKAFRVNALGARNVAVAAQELGAKLVFLSTDYVFGGENESRTAPYTEFDTPVPLSVYGKSKVAGENLVKHLCSRYFIVRASGLFGVAGASGKGGNFVETMLRLAKEKDQLAVVSDQVFSPTYTKDLAGGTQGVYD